MTKLYFQLALPLLFLLAGRATGDNLSISEKGINSKVTGLDGSGVLIGQAEPKRSGKAGYDDSDHSADNVFSTGVYFQPGSGMDGMDSSNIDEHATSVAGIMIGKTQPQPPPDPPIDLNEGVAPNAQLHSIGFNNTFDDIAFAMQRLALLENGTVRAINISFGVDTQPFIEDLDGNAHITQFVDWSAERHNVLYVVSFPDSEQVNPSTPSDNFNGITVAASRREGGIGNSFDRWSQFNGDTSSFDAVGTRTSIDLLAPGQFIFVNFLGDAFSGTVDGPSYAAPHVTGAAALLQQYAQQQIDAMNPRFDQTRSKRHEVMKAVMLNSADKIAGVHGSSRDILDSLGMKWTDTAAHALSDISLDAQLGAGHLNVERAVTQFASGEYDPGMVPLIGWDYGSTGGIGQTNEYVFSEQLTGDQYIAITLVWNRQVEKTTGGNYQSGDQFIDNPLDDVLANLDVYLMPANEIDLGMAVAKSNTLEDNVEHIFFDDFQTGDYKIVVKHEGGLDATTDYALSWWFGDPAPMQTGDYDGNGTVGPEDYTAWRSSFGSTMELDADGNGDDVINAADYVIWRDNLGAGSGSGSLAAVPEPEPSGVALLSIAVAVGAMRRRKFG